MDLLDRLSGTLLGTAVGDALGLPAEGMSPKAIRRRFGTIDRFMLLGRGGIVSDDTEQSALVAQSLARRGGDIAGTVAAFRRSLAGWFLRLPWGIGLATLRACVRVLCGLRRSGVASAGNGAAMRSAIIGTYFCEQTEPRRAMAIALAEVTHLDPRAVQSAVFVADVSAACARTEIASSPLNGMREARAAVTDPSLGDAIDRAITLASEGAAVDAAATALGTTGFVIHTIPFATYCLLRGWQTPRQCLIDTVGAGGDTDSIGAIVGAWLGALHGEAGLPREWVDALYGGPFGPKHLRALANDLTRVHAGGVPGATGYSVLGAMVRNLAMYPVILAHGFRRLVPW